MFKVSVEGISGGWLGEKKASRNRGVNAKVLLVAEEVIKKGLRYIHGDIV